MPFAMICARFARRCLPLRRTGAVVDSALPVPVPMRFPWFGDTSISVHVERSNAETSVFAPGTN